MFQCSWQPLKATLLRGNLSVPCCTACTIANRILDMNISENRAWSYPCIRFTDTQPRITCTPAPMAVTWGPLGLFLLALCCHQRAEGQCLSQKSAWDITSMCPMLQTPPQCHKSCPPSPAVTGYQERQAANAAGRPSDAMPRSLLLTSAPRWTSPKWPQPPHLGTPQEIHSAPQKKIFCISLAPKEPP